MNSSFPGRTVSPRSPKTFFTCSLTLASFGAGKIVAVSSAKPKVCSVAVARARALVTGQVRFANAANGFLSFSSGLKESVVLGLRLRTLHCSLFGCSLPHSLRHTLLTFFVFSASPASYCVGTWLRSTVCPSNTSCECLDGKRLSLPFGDGDLRASVHVGSNVYEALGEGLQDHLVIYDEHEREEDPLLGDG